jgi:uncharacterized protein with HEPN domain
MYVQDMLLSISRIEEYTGELTFEAFSEDYRTIDAVIRNFEILGEASKNIPDAIKSAHPDVPWTETYLLRNRVAHAYFGVDIELLWDVIRNHLPQNKPQLQRVLDSEL